MNITKRELELETLLLDYVNDNLDNYIKKFKIVSKESNLKNLKFNLIELGESLIEGAGISDEMDDRESEFGIDEEEKEHRKVFRHHIIDKAITILISNHFDMK